MALNLRNNFARAILAASITDVATQLTVTAGHTLPTDVGFFPLVIWDQINYPDPADDSNLEIVLASFVSTNTYNITRAQENTIAIGHAVGNRAALHYTAQMSIDDLTDHTHAASAVISGEFADARISESSVTQHQGAIDHGSILGLTDDDHGLYHTDGRAATWLAANHETTYAHSSIALNTTHRGSDGSDHSKVTDNETAIGLNTTHRGSNGTDHSYIDQDVTTVGNPQFASIELGHANDTTLTRVSAGLIAVEGTTVMMIGDPPTAHVHDGDTLQFDGVNSNGGVFAFNTTGAVTFNQDVSLGTGELTTGSINRTSGTMTLEIGGTAELSITTTGILIQDGSHIGTDSDPDYLEFQSGTLVLTGSNALNVAGTITASNYTAANLLTACATNAGALDFSAASKTLTVEDNAIVSQDYSSDAVPEFKDVIVGDWQLGTPTYDSVHDWMDTTQSAGRISGGDFTDNADGTLTVAAGTGLIKTTNSRTGVTQFFDWAENTDVQTDEVTPQGLTDQATNYIYVDYKAGSPEVFSTTTKSDITFTNKIGLGRVFRDGTSLHMLPGGAPTNDATHRTHEALAMCEGFRRCRGLQTSEIGDLGIAITEGTVWNGLRDFDVFTGTGYSSVDTDFTLWYNDGAWQSSATGVLTHHYNNYGTGLTATSPNHYGNFWVYLHHDGHVHVVYGLANYKYAEAISAPAPANLPTIVGDFSILIARITLETSETTTFTNVSTPWESTIISGTVTNHDDLAHLAFGESGHTGFLASDGSVPLAGAWDMGSQALTNVNIDSGSILVSDVTVEKDAANAAIIVSCAHDTEATTAILTLRKSDNTIAAPALVDDNAVLGVCSFDGFGGSSWLTGAKIEARVDGIPFGGDAEMPTELTFWTTPVAGAVPLQRVVIQPDGDVVFTGSITSDNYTAANLLTACATSAGGLDFSGAYTLTVGETATTTAYHTDARAATWLAANHETTYTHSDIAFNTTHRGSDGSDHSFIDQSVVVASSPTFAGATLNGTQAIGLDMSGGTFATAIQKWPAGTIQTVGDVLFNVNAVDRFKLDGVGLTLFSADASDQINIFHNDTTANLQWTAGLLEISSTEIDTITSVELRANGTGYCTLRCYDQDEAEYLQFGCVGGNADMQVIGTTPVALRFQDSADVPIKCFGSAVAGETPEFSITGFRTGDAKRALEIGVGVDDADTASFDGVSNYWFDGTVKSSGLTVTGATVTGLNSAIFQPTTDSITFFQVLGAGGGTPILNIDSTNKQVTIGKTNAALPFLINSNDASDQIQIYHDNANPYIRWTDGDLIITTDEGIDTNTRLQIRGKGTGRGEFRVYDQDNAEYFEFVMSSGAAFLGTKGTAPGIMYFQNDAHANAYFFSGSASGETRELKVYGYRAADAKRALEVGVGVDADDTASFDGVSNYLFDGTVKSTGGAQLGDGGTTNYLGVSVTGDVSFVGSAGFYPRFLTQADEPAAGTGATQCDTSEMVVWKDSDDSKIYMCFNDGGTVKTVELA